MVMFLLMPVIDHVLIQGRADLDIGGHIVVGAERQNVDAKFALSSAEASSLMTASPTSAMGLLLRLS